MKNNLIAMNMLMYISHNELNTKALEYLEKNNATLNDKEYSIEYDYEKVLKLIYLQPDINIRIIKCEDILK